MTTTHRPTHEGLAEAQRAAPEPKTTRGPLASGAPSGGATTIMKAFEEPAAEPQQAALVVINGRHMGEVHPIDQDLMVLGRCDTCDIIMRDDGISREHCRFRREGDALFIEDLESTNGTWVERLKITRRRLSTGDRIRLGTKTTIRFMYHDEEDEAYFRDLYEAAVRDGLTGAYNKRFLHDRLDAEIAFARRHGDPLSMIMFDIDHFKQLNDTFGHPTGDAVLAEIAKTIRESSRAEDLLARFGGDEFAIVARGLDAAQIYAFAERVRVAVETMAFQVDGRPVRVTLSLGTATMYAHRGPRDADHLLEAADRALYTAKRAGRNQVAPRMSVIGDPEPADHRTRPMKRVAVGGS